MRASAGVWAIIAASALLSCGSTRAAVFVRVDTDILPPMDALRSVRVRVYSGFGPTRTPRHDSVRVVGGDGGVGFPFRFVVLPLGDDEGATTCDLARVLDAAHAVTQTIVRHRAELVRRVDPLPPVLGSEARLGKLCLMLLLGAARAIPEGAVTGNAITVVAEARGGRVTLTVEDTGAAHHGDGPPHLPRPRARPAPPARARTCRSPGGR